MPNETRLVMFLRKPPGLGPFPVVVMIHGGLEARSAEALKKYTLDVAYPSRFLAAGYAVAVITYRSRDDDPQSRVSAQDALAAVNHVRRLSYVDPKSVVVYGCSGGGDLALELAAMTHVAAFAAEEPASVHFTGITNRDFPRSGPRFATADSAPILAEPTRYYTSERQTIARDKIGKTDCIAQPEQTEGPYFVDKVLERSDIRVDPATGNVSPGAPLALQFIFSRVTSSGDCAVLPGAQVDVWHCDAVGVYSDTKDGSGDTRGHQFLRGYQVTDGRGIVRFNTIYPGWYRGRAVHIHFKVRTPGQDGRVDEFTS